MTDDLVERLRRCDRESVQALNGSRIFGEAADEIERLRKELRENCVYPVITAERDALRAANERLAANQQHTCEDHRNKVKEGGACVWCEYERLRRQAAYWQDLAISLDAQRAELIAERDISDDERSSLIGDYEELRAENERLRKERDDWSWKAAVNAAGYALAHSALERLYNDTMYKDSPEAHDIARAALRPAGEGEG